MPEGRPPEREGASAASTVAEKPPPIAVERITHQDIPSVCGLLKKVWDAEATGLPPELVKSWQPTPLEFTSWMEGVTYFAARHGGRVVGLIGCELDGGSCHLVSLAVDPEVRRQGAGKALLAAAVEWARRANAPEVWIDILPRFHAARELLRHHGFTEAGELHKRLRNEDVLFFEQLL